MDCTHARTQVLQPLTRHRRSMLAILPPLTHSAVRPLLLGILSDSICGCSHKPSVFLVLRKVLLRQLAFDAKLGDLCQVGLVVSVQCSTSGMHIHIPGRVRLRLSVLRPSSRL